MFFCSKFESAIACVYGNFAGSEFDCTALNNSFAVWTFTSQTRKKANDDLFLAWT
jgi:hypothetical protein